MYRWATNKCQQQIPNSSFWVGPNHKPALIFARLVSNRGFLELALPDVKAMGGYIWCVVHMVMPHVTSWTPWSAAKNTFQQICTRDVWLVVWNMTFIFHFIYGMSSFPLTNIFKMVKTTNQMFISVCDHNVNLRLLDGCFTSKASRFVN